MLKEQYKIQIVEDDEEIALPHFNRYRVKFRKVFAGEVKRL